MNQMFSVIVCIIAGLIVTDILSFFIHNLVKLFSEKKNNYADDIKAEHKDSINKIIRNKNFREYLFFVFHEFQKNKKYFLFYYMILALLTVSTTLFAVEFFGFNIKAILSLVFIYSLIILTFVDAKTQILPDYITKPLIAIGIVQGYFGIFTDLKSSVLGAIFGYGTLWTINTLFRLIRKKDGMGYGDFKLLSAMGAWIGYQYLPMMILFSSFIGIVVAIIGTKLAEKDIASPTPFGPSLAISGFISLFWGERILNWYLALIVS